MNYSPDFRAKRPAARDRRLFYLYALSLATFAAHAGAQTAHNWIPGTGNWSTAAQWSTATVPDSDAADVYIDNGTTGTNSTVFVDGEFSLGRLTLDAGDTLSFNNGGRLVLRGGFGGSGTVNNAGVISLNSTTSNTDLFFFTTGMTLTGGGTVNLANNFSRLIGGVNRVLTNVDNLIQGAGYMIGNDGQFTNQAGGVVAATLSGQLLTIDPNQFGAVNQGTFRASNGGILELVGTGSFSGEFTNTGGTITALDGSEVRLTMLANIIGGTLATEGTGAIRTAGSAYLAGVANSGAFVGNDGSGTTLSGTINNTGSMSLDSTTTNTSLSLRGDTTLTGGGTVNLANNFSIFTGRFNDRLTNANNIIQGAGHLGANQIVMTNQADGLVDANLSGQTLTIDPNQNGLLNQGTFRARDGGILQLEGNNAFSGDFTNTGATISALDGSEVRLNSLVSIVGGTLSTEGTGVIRNASSASLTNLTIAGNFIGNDGSGTTLNGTITNTGTISLNSTATKTTLGILGNVSLTGGGTVNLANSFSHFTGRFNDRLTNVDNIIQGAGELCANEIVMTNQAGGLVDANLSGQILTIDPNQNGLVNEGTFRASNGGILQLMGNNAFSGDFTNSDATISALDGSEVRLNSLVSIAGGTLTTAGTGVIRNATSAALANLTNAGNFIATDDSSTTISGTVTNTGSITLLANSVIGLQGGAVLNHAADALLAGIGTINVSAANASISNNGEIAPGLSAGVLTFIGNTPFSSTAELTIELGGTTAGSGHDQLVVTSGAAMLNGTLNVSLINGFVPANTDTFTILTATGGVTGVFANAPVGKRFQTTDASGTFIAVYNNNSVVLSNFIPGPPPAQLLNISTRLRVLTGENVLIGGFIVTGGENKQVIIRAIGPSLAGAGVAGVLEDPTLELYDGAGDLVAQNDDWENDEQAAIEATTIPPSDDRESAIVRTLAPGAYTAIVRGKDETTGVGLVEAFDLALGANSKLANISTRGFVETGENVMIGGFILGPADRGNGRVIVRAIGPSLTASGVDGALQDPTMELYNGSGTLITSNDNWKDTQRADIEATQIPPADDRESAIVATLPAGNYTAIVSGVGNTTGVALVEGYNLE